MTAKPKTHTFTLGYLEAKYLAQVGLSGASTDDITPVICAANFIVADGKVRVISTDRYRCHTAIVRTKKPAKDQQWLIDREALVWLVANAAFFKRRNFGLVEPHVVFTVDEPAEEKGDHVLTITIVQHEGEDARTLSMSSAIVKGNFPPVIRLFDEARAAEAGTPGSIRLEFFSKARVLAETTYDAPLLKFTDKPDRPHKTGPLLLSWTRPGETEAYAEAIIQPVLATR